jgi:hypothetical protein
VEHFGYIAHDIDPVVCDTYEEAQQALIEMLRDVIQKKKDWAKDVLQEPSEWDEHQVRSAKKVAEFSFNP